MGGGEVRNVEGLRLSRSGEVCDVLITLSLLRDKQDKPIAVASIAKDVTAFKARQAAEEANRGKKRFPSESEPRNSYANERHHRNNRAGAGYGTDRRNSESILTTIESSADSLLSLINDILDFSKIEAKKLELDPTDFDLRERIGETLSTLAMRAHSKGARIGFRRRSGGARDKWSATSIAFDRF